MYSTIQWPPPHPPPPAILPKSPPPNIDWSLTFNATNKVLYICKIVLEKHLQSEIVFVWPHQNTQLHDRP